MERTQITIPELLIHSAYVGISAQRSDGSMPPGCNGPWNDHDTPVRNTAHWLNTFGYSYSVTQDRKFHSAADKAARYLTSSKAIPNGATFFCRDSLNVERSNGLIGQCWAIEGLLAAARCLQDETYLNIAADVFKLHPFDRTIALWKIVEPDGTISGFRRAINQHIWFAAIGAELCNFKPDEAIRVTVEAFVAKLARLVRVDSNGLIGHTVAKKTVQTDVLLRLVSFVSEIVRPVRRIRSVDHRELSVGYHSFNLYGLRMLVDAFGGPDNTRFKSMHNRAIDYVLTDVFERQVQHNRFAWGYNPTGFEIAYALSTRDASVNHKLRNYRYHWIQRQISHSLDKNTSLLTRNAPDPLTASARVYELIRLIAFNEELAKEEFDVPS